MKDTVLILIVITGVIYIMFHHNSLTTPSNNPTSLFGAGLGGSSGGGGGGGGISPLGHDNFANEPNTNIFSSGAPTPPIRIGVEAPPAPVASAPPQAPGTLVGAFAANYPSGTRQYVPGVGYFTGTK